jgi:alpha-aminoadipic semialdehyde synthase
VTQPLVDYLTKFESLFLTVASNDVEAAENIVRDRARTESVELDVSDIGSLRSLVRHHDVVVSLLPATMHVPIAELCIAERRHLVTTSYTSPEMANLNDAAKQAGVTVLNEVGLDPGIDHLLAMRVINEAAQRGARLTSFVSHCGGVPAPEASNNPFGYKFSWSPLGVLAAANNGARFRRNNELIELEPGTVFQSVEP